MPSKPRLTAVEHSARPQTQYDAKVSIQERSPPAKRVVKNASQKSHLVKTKKDNERGIDLKNAAPNPSLEVAASIPAVVASQASPPIERKQTEAPRKRTIMGRYVYGDEPKPGERWKRKLRKKW